MWRRRHRLRHDPRNRAAAMSRAALRRRSAHASSGALSRVDGWPKVTGTDLFGADEAPADALWMRVVRSPHARARFTLGDLEAVRRARPGLAAILTRRTCRAKTPSASSRTSRTSRCSPTGIVRYRGEAVLALVGDARGGRGHRGRRPADRLATRSRRCRAIDAALAPTAPAAPRRMRRQRADPRHPAVRRRRRRLLAAAPPCRGSLRDRPSSSTPISSRRPAMRCRVGDRPIASRSPPAPRRPTWTATRSARVLGRRAGRACASCRPPAAAASAASSMSRCSRCSPSRPG